MACKKRTTTARRLTRILREAQTDLVCDLLACAEEASLAGQHPQADYWRSCAEHAALFSGDLSLVSLVWQHSPVKSPVHV